MTEILRDERMASKLSNTKAVLECRSVDEFYAQLAADARSQSGLVQTAYGLRHVERAVELQAVAKLLVLDDLFRHAASAALRRRYVALVDRVRRANPDRPDAALICSSQHTASASTLLYSTSTMPCIYALSNVHVHVLYSTLSTRTFARASRLI